MYLKLEINKRKKIVVVSPHPDDETLACGGTILKKIHDGYEAVVLVITDGRHALSANDGIEIDPSPDELKLMRRMELNKVVNMLGIAPENLFCLDFEDLTVERNIPQIEKCVTDIFCKLNPKEISEIYFPCETSCHKDHKITSEIIQRSIRELRIPASCYKYTLPPSFSEVDPVISIDISPFLKQKTKALKQYKSQIRKISEKQNKPVLQNIKRYLQKQETFTVG